MAISISFAIFSPFFIFISFNVTTSINIHRPNSIYMHILIFHPTLIVFSCLFRDKEIVYINKKEWLDSL